MVVWPLEVAFHRQFGSRRTVIIGGHLCPRRHGWQVALRPNLRHSCAWVEPSIQGNRWKTLLAYIVARIIPPRSQKFLEIFALLAR